MPVYDYRRDLIQIIAQTSNSERDLKNLSLVLKLVSNLSLNTQNTLSDDEFKSFLAKFSIQSLNQSNTSTPQPEDSKDAAATAKQVQAQAQTQTQAQAQAQVQSSCEHQQYLVHRLLYGARLIDEDGNAVVRIGEWLARRFDLKHCDRVTAQITSQNPEHPRVIIDEVDHCHQAEDQNIEYFNLGLIEQVGSQLVVAKSADGSHTLAQSNPTFSPYRISPYTAQKFSLHAGDIVDLAWYVGAPRTTRIVWKHSADERQAAPARQTKKHSEYRNTTQADTTQQADAAQLDFNLHGQTVAVIVGDSAREAAISKIITAHHGHPQIVDGFKASHRSDYYAQAISDADIVVTVQNYTNHEVTSAVMTAIAQSGNSKKTAIAHTNSPLMIERAIYRASVGMPAYESAGAKVNYPVKQS